MKTHSCSIDIEGMALQIDYTYQPHEPMTLTYPGCKQSVEIEAIHTEPELELPSIMCTDELYEQLETEVLKYHRSVYSRSRQVSYG